MESDETKFVTNIPVIVKQAEERIGKDVKVPAFRRHASGSLSAANKYMYVPADFIAPHYLSVTTLAGDTTPVEKKDESFIVACYPASSTTGLPKFYAIKDDTTVLLGPTPDLSYTVDLHYYYKAASIVTAGSSWLGTMAESVLLSACLVQSAIFLKSTADLLTMYQAQYKEAIAALKLTSYDMIVDSDEYRPSLGAGGV